MTDTVQGLVKELFAMRWRPLHGPGWDDVEQLRYPGVYLLAYTAKELNGQKIKVDDVFYVGMSNSAGGVRARLNQFKSALEKGYGHSGGDHCYRHHNEKPFLTLKTDKKFYFAPRCLKCSSLKSNAGPHDFRTMGNIASLEYHAIAHVQEHSANKIVPQLNFSAGGVLIE